MLVLLAAGLEAQSGPPAETPAERDARMQWWREARFGMFVHWGVYSVPAGVYDGRAIPGIGEWIMNRGRIPVAIYKEYATRFDPVNYDPDAWVRLALEAGMKYLVITSKHHDGFALFDSKVTDWDVVDATPYGKDLLAPLAEACRRHGLVLGFYYSQAQDWCHPGGAAAGGHWDPAQDGDMDRYLREIAVPQVEELLTHYGRLGVLWWDAGRHDQGARGPVAAAAGAPAVARHQQSARRWLPWRLLDARAGDPGDRPRRRLGDVHDDERYVGLQAGRPALEVDRDADPQSDRHRVEGRQLPAERRADPARRDPGAERRAAARDRCVDERPWRGDPRHRGEPVPAAPLGTLHEADAREW
ncbi:MAG: alpha-L-fucosidase [Planctomycetes bacterium]|nr:alpha-L-fucosidase [Planctomycetota bacterium]